MKFQYFNIVNLIVSFLGGGIVSAVINWIRSERADKKERKIKFLDDQLRNLYGPIYYFVSQSEKCFELHKSVLKSMDIFFQQNWSNDDRTTEYNNSSAGKSLYIVNLYIKELNFNNQKIKEILDDNYSYIDPDDIEEFILFNEHYLRKSIEIDNGNLIVPKEIYQQIGKISLFSTEFVEKIKLKFKSKKKELYRLLNK